jgi:TetR/AcrR family transcriptional regulator, ethionamide resistance regulator
MIAIAPSVDVKTGFDFGQALLVESQNLRKRDRTRATIQNAACSLLSQKSLGALTVSEICCEAHIAHGTFYLYFPDLRALVADLLLHFIDYIQTTMHVASKSSETDSVRGATAAYLLLFEQNPGLMKCLLNHLEEFPASNEAFQKLNREWVTTVVGAIERKRAQSGPLDKPKRDELFRRAYALGGMVDQYLSALFLNKDPALATVSEDREAVIDTLTHIWKRGLTE